MEKRDLYEKIVPRLPRYMRDFLSKEDFTDATRLEYARDLLLFYEFMGRPDLDRLKSLSKSNFEVYADYVNALCGKEMAKRKLTTVRSLMLYLNEENDDLRLVREWVPLPRLDKKEVRAPKREDIIQALLKIDQASRDQFVRVRNKAIMLLMLSSGLRTGEVASIQMPDISADEMLGVVKGKGGQERIFYFNEEARDALKAWTDLRGDAPGNLFISNQKKPIGVRTIEQMFNRYAGFQPKLARKYFATRIAGVADLEVAQKALGHRDVSVARKHYIDPIQTPEISVASVAEVVRGTEIISDN